ncbi:MAG: DHH family phosphoesterase [bacterium]
MKQISSLFEELKSTDQIVITMHQKPDPDAMGSALGLFHFFKRLGNPVKVISPTNWADFLKWMPGCDEVIDFESEKALANQYLVSCNW